MYLSNKSFIEKYFLDIDNVDEVLNYLEMIYILLKRYGKKLISQKILFLIKEKDNSLYNLILFLKRFGKLNLSSIKDIENLLKKKYPNYTKRFELNTNDKIVDKIIKELQSKFGNVDLNIKKLDDLYLFVKGEGYYFKKSLDIDLNKLLKI